MLPLSAAHIFCQQIYPLLHSATPFFALCLSSLNHLLTLCFSLSIFFHPLRFPCHFICLCPALPLHSTFITSRSRSSFFFFSLPLYLPLSLTPSFCVSSIHLTFHIHIQLSLVLPLPLALSSLPPDPVTYFVKIPRAPYINTTCGQLH